MNMRRRVAMTLLVLLVLAAAGLLLRGGRPVAVDTLLDAGDLDGSGATSVAQDATQARRNAAAGPPVSIAPWLKAGRAVPPDVISELEHRLLPGNALDIEASHAVLASPALERIAGAISRRYAADEDVVGAREHYARMLQRHLAQVGATMPTFECGMGYCLGEVEGNLGPGGDEALADAVDAGAFAGLPWEEGPPPRQRFIFSTGPGVREVHGMTAGD